MYLLRKEGGPGRRQEVQQEEMHEELCEKTNIWFYTAIQFLSNLFFIEKAYLDYKPKHRREYFRYYF
jgi:hypothetical protein